MTEKLNYVIQLREETIENISKRIIESIANIHDYFKELEYTKRRRLTVYRPELKELIEKSENILYTTEEINSVIDAEKDMFEENAPVKTKEDMIQLILYKIIYLCCKKKEGK